MQPRLTALIFVLISVIITCAEARAVTWTAGAGSAVWGDENNWDCQCVPSSRDDVVINNPHNATTVKINETGAMCYSLTIGGGEWAQKLIVQSSFVVGNGGMSIKK